MRWKAMKTLRLRIMLATAARHRPPVARRHVRSLASGRVAQRPPGGQRQRHAQRTQAGAPGDQRQTGDAGPVGEDGGGRAWRRRRPRPHQAGADQVAARTGGGPPWAAHVAAPLTAATRPSCPVPRPIRARRQPLPVSGQPVDRVSCGVVALDQLAHRIAIGVGGWVGQLRAGGCQLHVGRGGIGFHALEVGAQVAGALATVPGLGFGRLRAAASARTRGVASLPSRCRAAWRALDRAAGLDVQPALGGVVLEVAIEERGAAAVHLDDGVGHAADQVAIVGDQHDRAGEAFSASSSTSRLVMSRWLVGSSRHSRLAGSAISLASASLVLAAGQDLDPFLDRVAGEERRPAGRGSRCCSCARQRRPARRRPCWSG